MNAAAETVAADEQVNSGAGNTAAHDADVVSALCRTANLVRQHLEEAVLHPANMTWTSYDILHIVVVRKAIEASSVAKTNGISKSTVTVAARALVARNLILRSRGPRDQRHVTLRPTTLGWQLLHDLQPRIAAEQRRLLDGLVPGFGPHALRVLRHIATMRTAGPAPGPRPHRCGDSLCPP